MIPGEWEPRRRTSALRSDLVAPADSRSTVLSGGPAGSVPRVARAVPSASSHRPLWLRVSLATGLLLVVMLLVMWGASVAR
jgi:hypothetical protein